LNLEHDEQDEILDKERLAKTAAKEILSNLVDVSSQECEVSETIQKESQVVDNISDSSSDDSIENCESGMGTVLKDIEGALSTENIEELAKNLLDGQEEETEADKKSLDDSEVQRYLDDDDDDMYPPKKKRRMPGYRKVKQKLSTLFNLDVYNDRAKEFYAYKNE